MAPLQASCTLECAHVLLQCTRHLHEEWQAARGLPNCSLLCQHTAQCLRVVLQPGFKGQRPLGCCCRVGGRDHRGAAGVGADLVAAAGGLCVASRALKRIMWMCSQQLTTAPRSSHLAQGRRCPPRRLHVQAQTLCWAPLLARPRHRTVWLNEAAACLCVAPGAWGWARVQASSA